MADLELRALERRARSSGDPADLHALAAARARAGFSLVDQALATLSDLGAVPPEWRPLRGPRMATSWGGVSRVAEGGSARVGDVVWCSKAKAAALVVGVVGTLPGEYGSGPKGQSARLCVAADGAVRTVTSYPRAAFRGGDRLRLEVPAEWKELARAWRTAERARRDRETLEAQQ